MDELRYALGARHVIGLIVGSALLIAGVWTGVAHRYVREPGSGRTVPCGSAWAAQRRPALDADADARDRHGITTNLAEQCHQELRGHGALAWTGLTLGLIFLLLGGLHPFTAQAQADARRRARPHDRR